MQITPKSKRWGLWGILALTLLACQLVPSNTQEEKPVTTQQVALASPVLVAATNTPRPTFTPTVFSLPPPVSRPATGTAVATGTGTNTIESTPTPTPLPSNTPPPADTGTSTAPPSSATAAPTAIVPTTTPTATSTAVPSATPSPAPTATETPNSAPAGMQFAGLHTLQNPEGTLRVTGELVNESSTAQTLFYISGTFLDAAGQISAGADDISDYWPTDAIPPGGHLPFELTVDNTAPVADFSLEIHAEPASIAPRIDFTPQNIIQSADADTYCVDGTVTLSAPMPEELIVILTGFASDNAVIAFDGEYLSPAEDGSTADFSICLDNINSSINHHSLQIWGL